MKRIIVLCLLLALILACVPTPEQEVVHQKDEKQMIEEAQKPVQEDVTIPEQVQAPEKWMKNIDEDRFHIRAEAPIVVPDCSAYPIYETEAVLFTQAQVDLLWERLVGERAMRSTQIEDAQLPKSQLALMMQNERDRIEEFEQNEYYEENVRNAEERIRYYQSLYADAPEDWVYTPVTSEIREIVQRSGEDTKHIWGIDATDGNGMTFQLIDGYYYEKSGKLPIPYVQFVFRRSGDMLYIGKRTDQKENAIPFDANDAGSRKDGLTISPREAIAAANAVIQSIDAAMEPERIEFYNTHPYNEASGARYDRWCYAIVYHRTAGGCPVAVIDGATGVPSAGTPSWYYEHCVVLADDDGIGFVEWNAPLAVGECRVPSAKLLTFAEAEALAETMLRFKYAGQTEGADLTVNVTNVRLELMRTVQQDNVTKGLLIPVWNFYGTRQRRFSSDQFDDDETMTMRLLSLNAVTGTPIDESLGY